MITKTTYKILKALDNDEEIWIAELTRLLGLKSPTMVGQQVIKLVNKSKLLRYDKKRGPNTIIKLTELGKKELANFKE